MLSLDGFHTLAGRRRRDDIEFIVQRELIFQRLTQVLVVIDDENLARCAHANPLRYRFSMASYTLAPD
jgi:hypothetical protein